MLRCLSQAEHYFIRQWEPGYNHLADQMYKRAMKERWGQCSLAFICKGALLKVGIGLIPLFSLGGCHASTCCDNPKVDTVSSWWGWDESLQSPGSFDCEKLHLIGLLRGGSGFRCSDTVLTQHLQHREDAQTFRQAGAGCSSLKWTQWKLHGKGHSRNYQDCHWWFGNGVYTMFTPVEIKHSCVALLPP